jgi:GntR family transcriptional regulator, transcriptional repressor for pyruvate dehydrogenase complex
LIKSDKIPRERRFLSMSEQIAAEIQQRIRDDGLGPGDRLGTEEQLAREYGVSRPTLREALRILSSARLVRPMSGPKGGIFVTRTPEESVRRSVSDSIALLLDLKGTSIEELLEARAILEVPLARLAAARADAAAIEDMRAAIEESAANPDDIAIKLAAKQRFHRAIAAAAGNAIVESITGWAVEVLQPHLRELIHPVCDDRLLLDQQRVILAAIEARDPAAAEHAMRDHFGHLAELVRLAKRPPRMR